ncbi:hypothetical protein [Kushneria aurantia]|uniref:Uncharacterized protein n=1 Tax=Kushneria aurantia TaxID=504092 RepID=A0ABV6G550_9GAMM|nr:hypothetical protein [Kushneria aurantia]
MRHSFISALAVAGLAVTLSAQAQAAWRMVPADSRITAEVAGQGQNGPLERTYRVDNLNGTISDNGYFEMPLRLEQTNLLGDGGMGALLSGLSSDSAMVTLSTQIEPAWLNNLAVGDSLTRTLTLTARGNHFERSERVPMRVERLNQQAWQVSLAEPISIDTRQMMQLDNAQTILSLLGYRSLADTIPINFNARLIER